MHVFGGTACFSLLSAFLQLAKSIFVLSILCCLAHIAHRADPQNTQNILFSIFVASGVALSYILSR